MTTKTKYTPQQHQRISLMAQRKLGKAKQYDMSDRAEFMETCISDLEDQGVDDAEEACSMIWEEQGEE